MFWRDFGRYGKPWTSLYGDMERMQDEMKRLVSGLRRPFAAEFPPMNVWANEQGVLVTAEIPGIQIGDLDIAVSGGTLTLKGGRKLEAPENGEYYRQERSTGSFARTLELPFPVDAEKVEATLTNGVLEIKLPRAEADKPRKIAVRAL